MSIALSITCQIDREIVEEDGNKNVKKLMNGVVITFQRVHLLINQCSTSQISLQQHYIHNSFASEPFLHS